MVADYKGGGKSGEAVSENGSKSFVDCNSGRVGTLSNESIFITPRSGRAEEFEMLGINSI